MRLANPLAISWIILSLQANRGNRMLQLHHERTAQSYQHFAVKNKGSLYYCRQPAGSLFKVQDYLPVLLWKNSRIRGSRSHSTISTKQPNH